MSLTDQTRNDLKTILETIDQRLFELETDLSQQHEIAALQGLRENAAGMILEG